MTLHGNYTVHKDDSLVQLEQLLLNNTGNLTAFRTIPAPVWVPSSELRGTLTILWSCFLTLTACIFTALHLNVPANTKKLPMLREKLKWVVIGLIAPEVVLYLASSQFMDARRLARELNTLWRQKKQSDGIEMKADHQEDEEDGPRFDIKYGFFVVMGGLEIPIEDIQHYTNRWAQRGTLESGCLRLSVNGLLQLARLGHFIEVPTAVIDDKSKADTLQKFLIIVQVLWMALQCTVRKAYGLPVSFLEIHTLVHVVCALVMFVFWIKKPKDVTDPMSVDVSEFKNFIALMVQEQFHARSSEEFIFYPTRSSQTSQLQGSPSQPAFVWIHPTDLSQYKYLTDDDLHIKTVEWVHIEGNQYILKAGEALPSGLGVVARSQTWQVERFQRRVLPSWFNEHSYDDPWDIPESVWITEWVDSEPVPPSLDLQLADMLRLERVIEAVKFLEGEIRQPSVYHRDSQRVRYPEQHFHDAFTRSAGNFQYTGDSQADPDQILHFIFSSPILLSLLFVLPAVYGGIHLVVSDGYFATEVERLLWKIASIDIMVTMPAFCMLTFAGALVSRRFLPYESLMENTFATAYKLPGYCMLFVYILARLYLVVESFLSLRAVPIGAYYTPSWLQMIPHL
ncbi:hypothetical protein BGZ63DRAFT_428640 [Mariannaea sp. PMI_226]|nr:hypothetical protein BGZ63DRAFT_428640 [Mariannaea sp. PMI_226]